jgi:chemotaxis protein MotA
VFFAGVGVVFVCVFGGYIIMGGNIMIILKAAPLELVVILGAAAGAYIISTPKHILSKFSASFNDLLKGSPYTNEVYLELICLLYQLFKLAKSKGMLAIEPHVESPEESSLFQQFPKILADHHVVEFICDYLRMMTMGTENPHQVEDIMNEELEVHHHERAQMSGVFTNMGDGLPALGIVAAVLGVIKTMAAISEPPEVLGKMIGGALVGTFLGVFLAYGIVGPVGQSLAAVYDEEAKFYHCIKVALIAYLNGYAPTIAVEFARKAIPIHVRPSFYDVEGKLSELPAPA